MRMLLLILSCAVAAQDVSVSAEGEKITAAAKLNLKDGSVINVVVSKKAYSLEGSKFVQSEHEIARDQSEVANGRLRYSLGGGPGSYKISIDYMKEMQMIPDAMGDNFSVSKAIYTVQGVDGANALINAIHKDSAEIKKIVGELRTVAAREYKSMRDIENVMLSLEEKAAKLTKSAVLFASASHLQNLLFDIRNSTLMDLGKKQYFKNAKAGGISNDSEDKKAAAESGTGNERLKMPLNSSKLDQVEEVVKHETIILVADHLLSEIGKESPACQQVIKAYDSEEFLKPLTSRIKGIDSKKAYELVDKARTESASLGK